MDPIFLAVIGGAVLGFLLLIVVIVKSMYKVAEPDEALIISGFGAHTSGDNADPAEESSSKGFKIIVGKGVFVLPLVQTVRRLGLSLHKSEMEVECVTTQGIPVHVRGVVVYKVGDDFPSIANAARRFLEHEEEMDSNVHEVFAGHLRQIVGSMTVEALIRERQELADQARNSSAVDMKKLGLVIDSLQIQQVKDPTGYIENLAKPHQAAVEAEARIAAAERDQEATEREQKAKAVAAKATSDSEIEQAKLRAAADAEKARASQAGPLSEAEAKKAVVVQETEVAELEAHRTEMRLQTEVVKPAQAARDAEIAQAEGQKRTIELRADADKIKVTREAEAQAEATKLRGQAEAEATQVKGEAEGAAIAAKLGAEAEGIRKRAEALEQNQEAVINQTIAEKLPEIVEAAARAYQGVDHMVVLNGAEGMGDITGKVIGAGMSIIPMVQDAFRGNNGKAERPAVTAAEETPEA